MTDVAVGRLTVRCRAPARHEQWAIRTRRRLDGVARAYLPGALETVLGGAASPGAAAWRMYVEHLEVVIDFRPDDYDDVTVATLWAGGVRRALEALGAADRGVHVFDDEESYLRAATEEYLASSRLSWVFADLPCGTGWVLPLDFLAAFDSGARVRTLARILYDRPELARHLWDRLMPEERWLVAAAFSGRTAWGRWRAPAGSRPAAARSVGPSRTPQSPRPTSRPTGLGRPARHDDALAPGTGPGPSRTGDGGGAGDRDETAPAGDAVPGGGEGASGTVTFEAWKQVVAEAAGRGPGPAPTVTTSPAGAGPDVPTPVPGPASPPPAGEAVDAGGAAEEAAEAGWSSSAGGLVLLYPWLPVHLREAEEADPDHPAEARRRALAGLVAPGEDWPLADPLVVLLAGDDPEGAPALTAADAEAEEARAAPTLAAFAAALPGFEESSAEFLRREFLLREARVVPAGDGRVRVTLAPMPLDVALERLPYPLGPFRLPPGPVVHVERGGDRAR